MLGVPHVRARLDQLLRDYLAGFEPDPGRLENELGGFENIDLSGPDAFQQMLGNPEVVLGAIQSPAQKALLPHLEALVVRHRRATSTTSWTRSAARLLSSYGMITEAVRRRRVEAAPSDRFVEQLFGLELTQAAYDRGTAFIARCRRARRRRRRWPASGSRDRELPTPAEVDAPGLWLARIDLPDDL